MKRNIARIPLLLTNMAITLDRTIRGEPMRTSDRHYTEETTNILREYLDYAKENKSFLGDTFYMPLIGSLVRDNPKGIKRIEEATMDLALLISELENIETTSKERQEEVKKFLIKTTNQYLSEKDSFYRRFAA